MYPNALQARQMEGVLGARGSWGWGLVVLSMHGSRDTSTLLQGYILLPWPRVIVHIKQQSYDVYYIEVEEGHDYHEVRPGADAALLDVDSLAAAWVSQWRGEEMGLPLEPRQTVLILILTHLLNHSPAKHCPDLASHWSRSAQVSWCDSCSQTSQPGLTHACTAAQMQLLATGLKMVHRVWW